MSRLATIIIVLFAGLVLPEPMATGLTTDESATSSSNDSVEEGVPVSLTPSITVVSTELADQIRVDEAIDHFLSNGLSLPDLEIVFFNDASKCDGAMGRFGEHTDIWRIRICSDLAFVVTHEIAHAWERAHLSDTDRAAYIESRGLSAWSDQGEGWGERGVEDAAFVIQQSLMTKRLQTSDEWQKRFAAFELLTGQPAPVLSASSTSQ